jgi:hypothetical protein
MMDIWYYDVDRAVRAAARARMPNTRGARKRRSGTSTVSEPPQVDERVLTHQQDKLRTRARTAATILTAVHVCTKHYQSPPGFSAASAAPHTAGRVPGPAVRQPPSQCQAGQQNTQAASELAGFSRGVRRCCRQRCPARGPVSLSLSQLQLQPQSQQAPPLPPARL